MRRKDLPSEVRALLLGMRAVWSHTLGLLSVGTLRVILADVEGPPTHPDLDPATRAAVAFLIREELARLEGVPMVRES